MNKDIYLLGGNDVEMQHIKTKLVKNNQSYIDKNLGWGANIESYKDDIGKILEDGNVPIGIELIGVNEVEGVIDIDHHNEKSHLPASITQVMERLGLKMSMYDELIATNDSGFIYAMEKRIDEEKERITEKLGEEGFEKVKKNLIANVRQKDRLAQGITIEQEKQAEEAIKNREDYYEGTLTIIRLPHSKSATITDRLYGTYKNLLVISDDGETNLFGDGELCQKIKDENNGSWAGGDGLGDKGGNAFWGGYVDQKELEESLKIKLADSIFLPENTENFTDLGKKIFELGSFQTLYESCEISKVLIENCEISKVLIENKGKDISFKIKAKEGYNIYEVKRNDLFGGYLKYRDRRDEAQESFGFEDEDQSLPLYIFVQDNEILDQKISRGFTKIDKIKFEKNSYISGKYYDVIKNSNIGKEAIEKALNSEKQELDFTDASIEKPKILTLNDKSVLESINILLEGKELALYTTGSFHGYFETLESTGTFTKINIPSYDKYLGESDIKEAIKNTNKGVYFSADSDFKYAYIEALKDSGYEVEKIGNSGFDARNKYSVIIPTISKESHILKIGREIHGESFKEEKIAYCGVGEVYVIDLDEKIKIEEIMKRVEENEKVNQEQKFIDHFKLKSLDNGISSVIKIGGNEEFKYQIPDKFIKLSELRVSNTKDDRQNKTHTYEVILLDKEEIKGKKTVDLKIPDNYKGLLIGKGGSNIKRISNELGLKINLL